MLIEYHYIQKISEHMTLIEDAAIGEEPVFILRRDYISCIIFVRNYTLEWWLNQANHTYKWRSRANFKQSYWAHIKFISFCVAFWYLCLGKNGLFVLLYHVHLINRFDQLWSLIV